MMCGFSAAWVTDPRTELTIRTIVNAIIGLLATGGSTNHTIHIIAIAKAAGIIIDWTDFSELSKVILEELKEAIAWVNSHQKASAELSYDMMRQPIDRVEKFLSRVNFEYVDGDTLVKKVKTYFDILTAEGIVETKVDDDFYKLFTLD